MIFLTVKGETDQLVEGFAAGADDYVPKPFHSAELLARVRAGLRIVALQRERVRAEAERERFHRQHLERFEEANRLKEEFVSLVSHELRTPLTSILGYLEVVLEREAGDLTDEQEQYLSIVARNASRLLRVVGDLLFVAQLEAGKLTLVCEEVDLGAVAQEAIDAARPRASEKAIELSLDAPVTRPLRADRTRLAQLIDNLVSNAIKFTPEGGRVDVRLAGEDGRVSLSVADSGMGISKAEQARLFERFFRTEAATNRAIQGTGLGLAISKAIAEAHGGSIEVESEEGRGATFVVRLPLS